MTRSFYSMILNVFVFLFNQKLKCVCFYVYCFRLSSKVQPRFRNGKSSDPKNAKHIMFSLKTFCGLICREKHIFISYKLNRITKLCRGVAGSSGTSQSSCELSSQSLRGCSCDEATSKMMLDPTRTWWMLGISNYIIDMGMSENGVWPQL